MKELEARGIVKRHVSDGTPTKVSYELTRQGSRARARAGRAQDLGGPLVGLTPTARPPVTAARSISLQRAMPDRPQTPEDVKALVAENSIRFVRLWFTDILGQLKSFSISAEQLDDAFEGGMGFDGSSITGFNAIEESDMIAVPDPTTFNVLPWRPEDGAGVARMFADVQTPERRPYEGDPRHVLRRAEERAREMGFDAFNVGPELEYYLFQRQPRAPRSSTRAATSTSRRSTPARTSAATPCSRSSGSASRSSTPTTRSARPSTRSTCGTPAR